MHQVHWNTFEKMDALSLFLSRRNTNCKTQWKGAQIPYAISRSEQGQYITFSG